LHHPKNIEIEIARPRTHEVATRDIQKISPMIKKEKKSIKQFSRSFTFMEQLSNAAAGDSQDDFFPCKQ
jgi:hypothetical protein